MFCESARSSNNGRCFSRPDEQFDSYQYSRRFTTLYQPDSTFCEGYTAKPITPSIVVGSWCSQFLRVLRDPDNGYYTGGIVPASRLELNLDATVHELHYMVK